MAAAWNPRSSSQASAARPSQPSASPLVTLVAVTGAVRAWDVAASMVAASMVTT